MRLGEGPHVRREVGERMGGQGINYLGLEAGEGKEEVM